MLAGLVEYSVAVRCCIGAWVAVLHLGLLIAGDLAVASNQVVWALGVQAVHRDCLTVRFLVDVVWDRLACVPARVLLFRVAGWSSR